MVVLDFLSFGVINNNPSKVINIIGKAHSASASSDEDMKELN